MQRITSGTGLSLYVVGALMTFAFAGGVFVWGRCADHREILLIKKAVFEIARKVGVNIDNLAEDSANGAAAAEK